MHFWQATPSFFVVPPATHSITIASLHAVAHVVATHGQPPAAGAGATRTPDTQFASGVAGGTSLFSQQ